MAAMAQAWANRCIYEHGQPDDSLWKGKIPWDNPGQNLFIRWPNPPQDHNVPMDSWYNEKLDWDYNNGCDTGKVCGHYTAVSSTFKFLIVNTINVI